MTSSRTVLAVAVGGAGAALVLAIAAASAAGTAVADRQAAMKAMGADMKAASAFTGAGPYDAAKAKAAMDNLAGEAKKLKTLFPADSATDPKTAASPKIWQDTADFDKRLDALAAAAAAAGKAADAASFKAAFKPVGDSCKACHDVYRLKKG